MKTIPFFPGLQVLILLVCGGLLLSCGKKKSEGEEGLVFRYNETGVITSLDPAFASNTENIWVVHQLYSTLVDIDENLELRPLLANRWEVDSTGTIYSFYLRDDVYFHHHEAFSEGEGRKVTAADVVFSLERLADEKLGSPAYSIIHQLFDFSEEGTSPGLEAVNDTTLKLTLKQPFNPLLETMAMKYFSVVPWEVVKYYKEDFWENPVGSGPFYFKSWYKDEKLVLEKNPDYFESEEGRQLPYLDHVSISFIREPQVAFLEFVKGNFDFHSGLDASYLDQLLNLKGQLNQQYEGQFKLEKYPYLKTDYLGILLLNGKGDQLSDPLQIKKVRQALNFAVDRQRLVEYLRNNVGQAATSGFIPETILPKSGTSELRYSYDPYRARELLSEAGFAEGEGLKVVLSTSQHFRDQGEYLQRKLRDFGIEMTLRVMKEEDLRTGVASGEIPFFRKSWVADYAEGENFLQMFYSKRASPEGPNYFHFVHPAYDSLYEASCREPVREQRFRLYQQMEDILSEEAPVIPLYHDEVVRLTQNYITGLPAHPMNLLELKRVKMKKGS